MVHISERRALDGLRGTPLLEALSTAGCEFTDAVLPAIASLQNLTELDMSNMGGDQLTSDGLSELLCQATGLTLLNLSNNISVAEPVFACLGLLPLLVEVCNRVFLPYSANFEWRSLFTLTSGILRASTSLAVLF